MTRPTQTEGKQGWRAERQKRWNRGRATDGDPKEPKRCPFYKKIPAVSEVLGSKVCLSKYKYNTMCCLESEEIGQLITTDWQVAQNLRTYLIKFSRQYDQLVAFKSTGWTFNQSGRVEDIQPQTQGNISIYGMCQFRL
ncbi:hypothetical protein cypCar_00016293 [Cyprinus carpio]|nr:hypothetical protein cypCar_00016293 [Cyprinus carpio]